MMACKTTRTYVALLLSRDKNRRKSVWKGTELLAGTISITGRGNSVTTLQTHLSPTSCLLFRDPTPSSTAEHELAT